MLSFLSNQCVKFLVRHHAFNEKDKELYEYGFEIVLSTLFSLLSILCISMCIRHIELFFSFLFFFFIPRLFIGGYHAKTYFKCFIVTNSLFVVNVKLTSLIEKHSQEARILLLIFLSCVIIYIFAPVTNLNHPMTKVTYTKNKTISKVLSCFSLLVLISLYFLPVQKDIFIISSLFYISIAVMIIIEKIKRKVVKYDGCFLEEAV